jgi:tetratricopeptide (TPR) repeat protein
MLFLFAQVFEAQGLYDNAIDKLNLIEQVSSDSGGSDDNLYSRAFLNLGRLYYKQGKLDMAYKHLNKFFKESKKHESKELLDLARVNLGMIRGTQGLNDLIKLSKNSSYQDFLKMKLKYFNET